MDSKQKKLCREVIICELDYTADLVAQYFDSSVSKVASKCNEFQMKLIKADESLQTMLRITNLQPNLRPHSPWNHSFKGLQNFVVLYIFRLLMNVQFLSFCGAGHVSLAFMNLHFSWSFEKCTNSAALYFPPKLSVKQSMYFFRCLSLALLPCILARKQSLCNPCALSI